MNFLSALPPADCHGGSNAAVFQSKVLLFTFCSCAVTTSHILLPNADAFTHHFTRALDAGLLQLHSLQSHFFTGRRVPIRNENQPHPSQFPGHNIPDSLKRSVGAALCEKLVYYHNKGRRMEKTLSVIL